MANIHQFHHILLHVPDRSRLLSKDSPHRGACKTGRVYSISFSCKQEILTTESFWPGACPTKYRIDQIRSNSNFAWNSYRCAFEDSRPIITKFGTRYDRPTIIEIRGTRIFSKFWIRSNLSIRYLVGQAPGHSLIRVTCHKRPCISQETTRVTIHVHEITPRR